MWIVRPSQLKATNRWRLTATSDEDGGGPWGDESHDHATAEEAEACEKCDEYTAGITGFPTRKSRAEEKEAAEREEFERLKAKYRS